MFRRVAIALGAACLAAAAPVASFAHGDYDWINRGGYKNGVGELCCGTIDCEEIAKDRVEESPAGFKLLDRDEVVPHRQAIPSEDGKYWRCYRRDGSRRCFFYPLAGF